VIAQNANALKNTNMVWVIPLTSKLKALHLPVHIVIRKDMTNGLKYDSMALVESISYISKNCLGNRIGKVSSNYFPLIGEAFIKQFPMSQYFLMAS
jgi:mRNA-degrading endonuclease toxin of MazEF toxin-antitoxin module